MGNSSSSSLNSVVKATVVSGSWTGGQVYVGGSIEEHFEGGAESIQIITVKSLKVMKRELPGTSTLHHEFLLIEVHELTDCGLPVTILAEKVYNNEKSKGEGGPKVGGVIQILKADRASLEGAKMKCKIELKECGQIVLKDLFDDLKKHNLRYSLGMYNCWKYAYEASCKVLKRCEELKDTSGETKEAIKKFRETTLVKPELLGEILTPFNISIAFACGAALAGVLFYTPIGVGAVSAVKCLGMYSCCWKYACEASCKVLKRCEELKDSSGETKEAIKQFRETTLVKPELLGESLTPFNIAIAFAYCALLAGELFYSPFGVGAVCAVKGLGMGVTKTKVIHRGVEHALKFLLCTVINGVAYCFDACARYYLKVAT